MDYSHYILAISTSLNIVLLINLIEVKREYKIHNMKEHLNKHSSRLD